MFGTGGAILADTVTIRASKDTTLYESDTGDISNGVGDHMFVGKSEFKLNRRSVIYFDIADSIPAGASINSATLTLRMSDTDSGPQPQSVHRLLTNWSEGESHAARDESAGALAAPTDATWVYSVFSNKLWDNEGGDFVETESAAQSIDGVGFYSWFGVTLTSDVQVMLDDPSENFGWILIGEERGPDMVKRFDTKDNSVAHNRPALIVDFTPECVGDINGDSVIDTADLGILIAKFGTTGTSPDVNNDGTVDTADLGIMISVFGTSCP